MKRILAFAATVLAAVSLSSTAAAGDTDHTLVVDGVSYQSTKEAGDSIHFETPGPTPTSASFTERGQTWAPGDNGSDHLPCPGGIHWISNSNVLTISHCLGGGTTTSVPSSTVQPSTSTSTIPATTTSAPATTTTTSSPPTSTAPSSTTTLPGGSNDTTTLPESTLATTTLPSEPVTKPGTLPPTGSGDAAAGLGAALILIGGATWFVARRRA